MSDSVPSTTSAPIPSAAMSTVSSSSATNHQPMDAREPRDGSSIPGDTQADSDHLITNKPSIPADADTHIANVTNTQIASTQTSHPGMGDPAPKDLDVVVQSLAHVALKDESPSSGVLEPNCPSGRADSEGSRENLASDTSTGTVEKPNQPEAPMRLLSRNDDSITESARLSNLPELSSPLLAVQPQEPFAHQLQQVLANPLDEPDPRLIDALENPRDRLYVIKLEKDIIKFVQEKTCEIHDLPPINSYHRLLAHKTAEYYRLTHVADATGSSVRIYRGQAARIPPTRLCDWPVSQPTRESTASNSAPAVKIMRRAPSDRGSTTPPKESSTPRKDGSDTSSEPDSVSTKANTREEREVAYQQARARIFKDFVESPPETPPPGKAQEKGKKQKEPDDFSGRSQFFPVQPNPYNATPQYYSQPQYQEPPLQVQNFQQSSQYNVGPRFNPTTASFTPSSGFSSSNLPYMSPPAGRQQYSQQTKESSCYQPHPSQQLTPQSLYPPRSSPIPGQTSPTPSYNSIARQHAPPAMQPSFSSSGSGMSNPQGFQQGYSPSAPPAQSMTRHQYPVPGSFTQSSSMGQNLGQNLGQRMPNPPFGWNGSAVGGGVQMGPRSSSAPGNTGMDMHGSQFPYPTHGSQLPPPQHQPQWNTGLSRGVMGNGMGGMSGMGGINSMNGINGMNGMNNVNGVSGMMGGFGGMNRM